MKGDFNAERSAQRRTLFLKPDPAEVRPLGGSRASVPGLQGRGWRWGGCSFRRGQWDLWVLFSSALCQTEVAKRQIRLRPPREGQLKGAHVGQHDPGLGDTPPVLWTPQPPAATEDPEPCLPTEETQAALLSEELRAPPGWDVLVPVHGGGFQEQMVPRPKPSSVYKPEGAELLETLTPFTFGSYSLFWGRGQAQRGESVLQGLHSDGDAGLHPMIPGTPRRSRHHCGTCVLLLD